MIRRRSGTTVVALLALSAIVLLPAVVAPQSGGKPRRIGFVSSERRNVATEAYAQRLRELGYTTDTLRIEYRFGEGLPERVPGLVADLLKNGVEVLLTANPHVTRVARTATSTVPLVGVDLESDPVAERWIMSLARPGGNLTGFFLDIPELGGKQLQFLAEIVPQLQRVGIIWDARVGSAQFSATERAAQAAGLRLQSLPFRGPADLDAAFETARRDRVEALVVPSSPAVFANLERLATLAARSRMPATSVFPQFAAAGGLMGYGPSLPDLFRQAAEYVDRILKGERPENLPIQRPAVFKLSVNLKTAKTLGVVIPPAILTRADDVIRTQSN